MERLIKQVLKFGTSGIIVTILDFALVYVLGTYTVIPIMWVTFISYVISSILNYLLTVRWVFETDGNHKKNMIIFFSLGIVALCITQFVMWVGTEFFSFYFMVVKVVATIAVNVFNFITRKMFIEKKKREGSYS